MQSSGRKKVTMDDIAKRLGISKNSVSLALNNKPGVSNELRNRVIEVACQLNYGGFSINEKSKSKCIIIIVPEYLINDTFFYSEVLWAIEREAKNQGCISITTSITHEAEENLLLPPIPHEMNILGFLVIGIIKENYLKKLYDIGFPILTVDILYNNVPVDSIVSANINGAYTATKYLIDNGHRQIGFIGPIFAAQSIFERWCGFTQAMLKHNLEPNADYNILGTNTHFQLMDTVDVLEPYLDKITSYPTAWFCAGDRIAISLINILSKRNIRVPDDISIIGFDDLEVSKMIIPPLTTIKIDKKLMGKLAVDYLINRKFSEMGNISINLLGTLIVRESVKSIL